MKPPRSRIPVTVLGGYLGSGKTTVLNNLLSQTTGRRVAVLINDFGPINIDASLVAARSDTVIELTNGCICCSLVDGFADAMDDVLQRAQRDPANAPQHLIIETSGVALPHSVAQFAHRSGFVLDAIVVTADGEQLSDQLEDRRIGETVQAQLRSADVVLLTKTDLIDDAQAERAMCLIEDLSAATTLALSWGAVAIDVLLGAVDRAPIVDTAPASTLQAKTLSVTTMVVPSSTTKAELEALLATLPQDCVRVKGVVEIDGVLFHVDRVGPRSTIRRVDEADFAALKSRAAVGTLLQLHI